MLVEVELQLVFIVVRDGEEHIAEDDTEAIDGLNLGHMDNVGTMGAQELRLGQILVELLHRHERHELLTVLQTDTHIVLQALDIEDVIARGLFLVEKKKFLL